MVIDSPRYIGLSNNATAPSAAIHNRDTPDLMIFKQVNAIHDGPVFRYCDTRLCHAIGCFHFKRVTSLCDATDRYITIRDHPDRPHGFMVINHRNFSAVAT
jgi:hypothetical protein